MLKYTGGPGTCQALIDRVLSRLQGVRRSGKGWSALCPAHDDRHQSLSVSKGSDGRVLLKCHAGCDIKAIVRAIGLELRDLFPPKPERKREQAPTRVFEIRDPDGTLVALHERDDGPRGKSFVWKLPNGQTGLGGLSTKALPLYGSEKLRTWPERCASRALRGREGCASACGRRDPCTRHSLRREHHAREKRSQAASEPPRRALAG
jgi:hypothetical protein